MATARAQGFFHSNLASALGHRYQHDVHQPNSTDSKRQQSDESEQYLDADGNNLQLLEFFNCVENKYRPLVFRIETMVIGHRSPQGLRHFRVLDAFILDHDGVNVIGIAQIADRTKWHIHLAIDVVITILNQTLENADNRVGNAAHADAFADSILSREEFLFHVRTQHRHPGVSEVILVGKKTSFGEL